MSTVSRKVTCLGYDLDTAYPVNCGNTLYEATYGRNSEDKLIPVWKCTNCGVETPRHSRNRRTNRRRALDLWQSYKNEWKPIDEALDMIIDAGQPSGCLLAYGSTFNTWLDKLLSTDKPSNANLDIWNSILVDELQRAKEFVKKYGKMAYA